MTKLFRLLVWMAGAIAILGMVFGTVSPAQASSNTSCTTPTAPVGFGFYVVRKGDSLQSIASRFGVSVQAILALNPGASFIKGRVILLPGVDGAGQWDNNQLCNTSMSLPSLAQTNITTPEIPVTGGSSHTVVLAPIQSCVVPTAPTGFGYYVIQKGDTLQSIATKSGVSISTILSLNPSTSFTRHQVILLPSAEAVGLWDNQLLCP